MNLNIVIIGAGETVLEIIFIEQILLSYYIIYHVITYIFAMNLLVFITCGGI